MIERKYHWPLGRRPESSEKTAQQTCRKIDPTFVSIRDPDDSWL